MLELSGNRVALREFAVADADAVLAYLGDPTVVRFLPAPLREVDTFEAARREVQRAVQAAANEPRSTFDLAVTGDAEVIGSCRVQRDALDETRAEIGYLLRRNVWGRGYGTEVAQLLIAFGFDDLGIRRLDAIVDERNVASIRVLEKVGMRPIGALPAGRQVAERRDPSLIYALTRDHRDPMRGGRDPGASRTQDWKRLVRDRESTSAGRCETNLVKIVDFGREHQADVRALILAGLAERWEGIDDSLNRDLDDIARSYADGRVLVVVRDATVIGAGALVRRGEDTAELVRMAVLRAERRAGVGRQLVGALLDVARSWSLARVVCETNSTWTSALRFYLSCGFVKTHESDGQWGGETFFEYQLD